MTTQQSRSRAMRQCVLLLTTAILTALVTGCGKEQTQAVVDAGELLETYELDRRHHDPVFFSEVDLGEFTVTQRREPDILVVRFHLYGVVPDKYLEQFNALVVSHGERIRSEVREAVQAGSLEQLGDPTLGWLKSELISSINGVLDTRMLRDVVFGDFSFERG
ncbi:MAG: hypothetical protein FJ276_01205 [Planctomycetes bacterium]|nr:hypothetical protein [Planctomycetota bacterium]